MSISTPRCPELSGACARNAVASLRNSGYAPLGSLTCEFCDGTLILSGCVPSFFLKQMAQEVAMRTPGVDRVKNDLRVDVSISYSRHNRVDS